MRRRVDDVKRQYAVTDPLKIRIETHRLYEERSVDLDAESQRLLRLNGAEGILDVGCGPGKFLLHLRRNGHRGRLVGLDQSQAMIDEATASARDEGFEVEGLVGDAMHLPFEDNSFDWVSGRHMLYHVPDIERALQEFARVATRGVLVSTNGCRNLPLIDELIDDLLSAFGYTPVEAISERFCIENAGEMFDAAGFNPELTVIDNALVFTEVEPIVRYLMSNVPSFELPEDLVAEMEHWCRTEGQRRLDDMGGTWRDPKRMGMYLVTAMDS